MDLKINKKLWLCIFCRINNDIFLFFFIRKNLILALLRILNIDRRVDYILLVNAPIIQNVNSEIVYKPYNDVNVDNTDNKDVLEVNSEEDDNVNAEDANNKDGLEVIF